MSDDASSKPGTNPLTGWMPDTAPRMMTGTLARFIEGKALQAQAKVVMVVPILGTWKVMPLVPSLSGMIENYFAASSAKLACLYADDYLYRQGYAGPGIGPLPEGYPLLRNREDAHVPSKFGTHLTRGAKCECGYAGEDIVDRHEACPSCGGITMLVADVLSEQLRRRGLL